MTDELAPRRKRRAKRTKRAKPKQYRASENPKNGPGKRCPQCGEPKRDHTPGQTGVKPGKHALCPLIPMAVGVRHRSMVVWIPEHKAPKRRRRGKE